ncbi:SDR family oxidoreductase [Massilia sp. PAMC28688]|uniref:SDR family oxidoreductase n=1 Tax=Massilia sp. PAMC28688 TaxID=2861283 RepID=UPI001C63A064|nr:SDR family oxidoreductase [Massilia sp. PAMC28688]QYF92765.1 SDR family oxidoreductase [Massilia sp. PAMC28688]
MKESTKAIVTGHSKGLGEAIALNLLSRGIPVLGLARHASSALTQQYPSLCVQNRIDLANPAAMLEWLNSGELESFVSDCATVLLVNNAGTVQPVGSLHQQAPADVAAAVSLNVTAPLMLAAAVSQATPGSERRILHVSSGAARSAYPGWSVYCATKSALDHHARAVQMDAEEGTRICSLAPGIIDTGMQAAIRATPDDIFPLRQRFLDLHRQGQLVAPADCAAQLVSYLLADTFGGKAVDDLRHT